MLLIPFPLDLRTTLGKNIEIEMPPGENLKYCLGTFPIGLNDTTLVFNNTVPII